MLRFVATLSAGRRTHSYAHAHTCLHKHDQENGSSGASGAILVPLPVAVVALAAAREALGGEAELQRLEVGALTYTHTYAHAPMRGMNTSMRVCIPAYMHLRP